jgi:hypothetical protein
MARKKTPKLHATGFFPGRPTVARHLEAFALPARENDGDAPGQQVHIELRHEAATASPRDNIRVIMDGSAEAPRVIDALGQFRRMEVQTIDLPDPPE